MSIKISELPQASTVNNTDVIPIVQGGTTKKAPAGLIRPTIATDISSTSTNDEVAGAKAVYDFVNTPIDLSSAITYTASTGITIQSFKVTKVGGIFLISIQFGTTATTNKMVDIVTLTNVDNIITTVGSARTYGSPANSTTLPASCVIAGSTKTITLYTTGTSINGGALSIILPAFTISTATRSINLNRLVNTGELAGIGDSAELID